MPKRISEKQTGWSLRCREFSACAVAGQQPGSQAIIILTVWVELGLLPSSGDWLSVCPYQTPVIRNQPADLVTFIDFIVDSVLLFFFFSLLLLPLVLFSVHFLPISYILFYSFVPYFFFLLPFPSSPSF
jgi:hypothetical protein